jgi:hypothetical protein
VKRESRLAPEPLNEATHALLSQAARNASEVPGQSCRIPGHNARSLAALFRRYGFRVFAPRGGSCVNGIGRLCGFWSIRVKPWNG